MKVHHRKVRAKAPLRLGLAGGGTDLPSYAEAHGGAVLNVTIHRYAHASVEVGGGEVVMRAADLDRTERVLSGEAGADGGLPLHRAVHRRIVRDFLGGEDPGLKLCTMTDAPPGSGLGSSSALVVAMVEAFRVALDLPLGRYDIARLAFDIERKDLGLAGGMQDQYAAAFGGVNFIEFLAGERVIVNPLRLRAAVLHELEASLLVCFTGRSRASHDIIVDQMRGAATPGGALESFHQLKADAFEMKQALLRGDLDGVSTLLDASWRAKKATSPSISTVHIERLWGVAHEHGARGGKVSGAGGGGFLMFLCDPDRRRDVMRALEAAGGAPDTVSICSEGVEGWSCA